MSLPDEARPARLVEGARAFPRVVGRHHRHRDLVLDLERMLRGGPNRLHDDQVRDRLCGVPAHNGTPCRVTPLDG
jgi:hypothetical protein